MSAIRWLAKTVCPLSSMIHMPSEGFSILSETQGGPAVTRSCQLTACPTGFFRGWRANRRSRAESHYNPKPRAVNTRPEAVRKYQRAALLLCQLPSFRTGVFEYRHGFQPLRRGSQRARLLLLSELERASPAAKYNTALDNPRRAATAPRAGWANRAMGIRAGQTE